MLRWAVDVLVGQSGTDTGARAVCEESLEFSRRLADLLIRQEQSQNDYHATKVAMKRH